MTAVQAVASARTAGTVLAHLVRTVVGLLSWLGSWVGRHWRYVAVLAVAGFLASRVGLSRVEALAVLAVVVPAVVAAVWARWSPLSYERWAAGPHRRAGWRRWAHREWPDLARECGLSVQRTHRPWWRLPTTSDEGRATEPVWVHPRLMDVTTAGHTMTLLLKARRGQTVEDLERAAAPLAASSEAVSWRCRVLSPSVLQVALVMRETLDVPTLATMPTPPTQPAQPAHPGPVEVGQVRLGRRQDGSEWWLQLLGRHTLVVGCSGAGKGSVLWGVCGGLAPAVSAGLVRLWGLDLKKGVEIGMGRALFHVCADDVAPAMAALAALIEVIDERGPRMSGVTRQHVPSTVEPLHVLVIDELAALVGYTEPEVRKEANRLLSVILTQGRALGVVVIACVQNPRKDTIALRELFTATVALRLMSADETRMVLGDGMAALAPAHRISPTAPGTAWVVGDDGTVDRVRADYWPDDLIRAVAAAHPAPFAHRVEAPPVDLIVTSSSSSASSRKPRAPRAPRLPRDARPAADQVSDAAGGEAA